MQKLGKLQYQSNIPVRGQTKIGRTREIMGLSAKDLKNPTIPRLKLDYYSIFLSNKKREI